MPGSRCEIVLRKCKTLGRPFANGAAGERRSLPSFNGFRLHVRKEQIESKIMMRLRYALNKNWPANGQGGSLDCAGLECASTFRCVPPKSSASLQCCSTPEVAGPNRGNSPSGCGPSVNLHGCLLTLARPEGASGCLTVLRSGEPLLQRCGKAGIERSHGVTYIGLAVGRAAPICIRDGRFEIGTSR